MHFSYQRQLATNSDVLLTVMIVFEYVAVMFCDKHDDDFSRAGNIASFF
jgi:hypothetical protein